MSFRVEAIGLGLADGRRERRSRQALLGLEQVDDGVLRRDAARLLKLIEPAIRRNEAHFAARS